MYLYPLISLTINIFLSAFLVHASLHVGARQLLSFPYFLNRIYRDEWSGALFRFSLQMNHRKGIFRNCAYFHQSMSL